MKSLGFLCLVVVAGCQNKRDESSQASAASAPSPSAKASGSATGGTGSASGSAPNFAPTPAFEPPTTRSDAPYKSDVQKVCDVIELSGAKDHESHDRTYLTATWLGKNLETPDARKWLASLQRFKGNAKADALEQEARRVGLATCALANEWRRPLSP